MARVSQYLMTMKTANDIKLANLKADLEVLVTRMNEVPTRANLSRVKALRAEIAEMSRPVETAEERTARVYAEAMARS